MQPEIDNHSKNPAYLLITPAGGEPVTLPLEENNSLFVGSGANCRFVLSGNEVEPIHCMFWLSENKTLRVQDWNTQAGTVVNGQPITAETILNSGDELQIGDNRVVAVLSSEVHQRVAFQIKNTELIKQMSEDDSANQVQTIVETQSVELPEETPIEAEMPFETPLPPNESELESGETSEDTADPETSSFEYDVMADLDADDAYYAGLGEDLSNDSDTDVIDFGDPYGTDDAQALADAQNEEVELLRMEVEQLRFELAERDAHPASNDQDGWNERPVDEDDNQTIQLVNRLEELLEELQTSDDRVRGLEELLRASDQATQAEQEERQQLESWVTEVEQRVIQRESESEAEMSRLVSRLNETQAQYKRVRSQLKQALQSTSNPTSGASNELVQQFREQVEDLEQRLEESKKENEQLRSRSLDEDKESKAREELRQTEQKLVQLQVETSRERAEMSRQRAELERLKDELEEKLRTAKKAGNADIRIQAVRQHLREIHEEEKFERAVQKKRSLGGRISSLLNSVGR